VGEGYHHRHQRLHRRSLCGTTFERHYPGMNDAHESGMRRVDSWRPRCASRGPAMIGASSWRPCQFQTEWQKQVLDVYDGEQVGGKEGRGGKRLEVLGGQLSRQGEW